VTDDLEQSYDPPQDTGVPDPVESDPVALNAAEDLDEDRLRVDPLEQGMDPPEHWVAADKYGMTPWEQAHPAPLDDRLAEEQPDVDPDAPPSTPEDDPVHTPSARQYAEDLGISADEAGGSMPDEFRTPPPAR
jgi:pyruvate/2-oxoglutarate dehydrogenase complex dihydrolipoamide acyltransferase (E2) component